MSSVVPSRRHGEHVVRYGLTRRKTNFWRFDQEVCPNQINQFTTVKLQLSSSWALDNSPVQ